MRLPGLYAFGVTTQSATGARIRGTVTVITSVWLLCVAPPTAVAHQPQPSEAELLFWESIADSENPADFEDYLGQFPDGMFSGMAQRRTEALTEEYYELGVRAATRYGGQPDMAKAVPWLRLAGQHGHTESQRFLGVLYASGQDIPEDQAEAVRWFRRAAENGDASSQHMLGLAYDQGNGRHGG